MTIAFPFALVGLAGTVAYLAVFAALHVLPTGYSPIHNAVSDYGVGRYGRWFSIGLWSSSVSVLALAVGLGLEIGTPRLATSDLVILGSITVTRLGMSIFPTNLEGEALTRPALLHYLFAVVAFTLTYLAITHLSTPLRAIDPWRSVSASLGWLSWLVAPALAAVVITMIPRLRRVFGLAERIFLVTTNAWFLLVAALLVVKSG